MHKIQIEDIELEPNKALYCVFDDTIEEINCKLYSELDLKSVENFITVKGFAQGKITLTCDRCLNEYEQDINIKIEETFAKNALQDEYGQEFELTEGQFITDLNGEKEIDIYDLLYQSVILNLPNKKVCGINCSGDKFLKEENLSDPRMDVFKNIKINPKDK